MNSIPYKIKLIVRKGVHLSLFCSHNSGITGKPGCPKNKNIAISRLYPNSQKEKTKAARSCIRLSSTQTSIGIMGDREIRCTPEGSKRYWQQGYEANTYLYTGGETQRAPTPIMHKNNHRNKKKIKITSYSLTESPNLTCNCQEKVTH